MVGAEGFEPPTLCSQSRCATRLRYAPIYHPVTPRRAYWGPPVEHRITRVSSDKAPMLRLYRSGVHFQRCAGWFGGVLSGSGKCAVEMRVAAVDYDVLAGGVSTLPGGKQKDGHGCDFRGLRHAMAEGDTAGDVGEGLLGVVARGDPALVERRHHFSRQDGVGAYAEGGEFGSPFAGQGKLRAFGGCVGRGAALAGECDFGADVDDGTARGLQHGQRVVRHRVVVEKVLPDAFEEAIGRAGGEANSVVGSSVVDEAEHVAVLAAHVVNRALALVGVGEMRFEEVAFALRVAHFRHELFDVVGCAADDDDGGAFR